MTLQDQAACSAFDPLRRRRGALGALALLALGGGAAAARAEPIAVPFDSPRWRIQGEGWRLEEHLGRPSLFLPQGRAWLDDVDILDGAIEFDVAFSPERGFCGGLFRLQGEGDYEHFYLRPHQSGMPDANQYTPVFDGVSGWQLYHGEGYGAPVSYPYDRWIHVRIVFQGRRAEVFIDSRQPVLFVDELKREPRTGKVGVDNNLAQAHFSNFRYESFRHERLDQPVLLDVPRPDRTAPAGAVMRWEVSSPFAEARLEGRADLPEALPSEVAWSALAAESTGITNLARRVGSRRDANTVLARIRMLARRPLILPVRFGYSDRVRVYLDGRGLYAGDNGYQSRDYRYLGTIGLFDSVWLPLEPGEHELAFAVSESFGGWGIVAALGAASDGIEILPPD
jgi:hypothetical protein